VTKFYKTDNRAEKTRQVAGLTVPEARGSVPIMTIPIALVGGAAVSAAGWLLYRWLNAEGERSRAARARDRLGANARRALEMKRSNHSDASHPRSETADDGMRPIPNRTIAPSGALNQEGHRPVLERSRKVR
jgi:hypothetical protein